MAEYHSARLWDTGAYRQSNQSLSTSYRPSADISRSDEDTLRSRSTAVCLSHDVGASVPDAPLGRQSIPAENTAQANNRDLVSLKPRYADRPDGTRDPDLDDLDYWPTALKTQAVVFHVILYLSTATAIGVLMWRSFADPDRSFRLSSENVRMISRYFPSIIGTITVLLFRQTVREALRMEPYVRMADQRYRVLGGCDPAKGIGGSWFPWQRFTITPTTPISIVSLFCQIIVSFVVSFKVALLASSRVIDKASNDAYWLLSVRFYPGALLILCYIMMTGYTLYISYHFRGKSTGLKWDPISIADYSALFAQCNALEYFSPLELQHNLRPKHVMARNQFRLGYWTRVRDNPPATDTVYGIGVHFDAATDTTTSNSKTRSPLGRPWYHKITFRKPESEPKALKYCGGDSSCAHGRWPHCEHYPYNYNPGCPRWLIAICSVLPICAFALSIFALINGLPFSGFTLPNTFKLPSGFYWGHGNHNHPLPALDPADPKSTVLLWALIFRSLPTYIAGMFTSTIVVWIDLNMRFMQPFRNMLGGPPKKSKMGGFTQLFSFKTKNSSSVNDASRLNNNKKPATVSESILLAYMTVSPLQVPLTAWEKGHWKVCIYSTLSTLSPIFPIFVGGLITVTPDGDRYDVVRFSFSLSAYIGIMVSLLLYSVLIPAAIPQAYRLLPRQLYSLADLMAMCHQSRFMASPDLDITQRKWTPSKEHMEAKILHRDDRFLFGVYQGRDGVDHIGFDVAEERDPNTGEVIRLQDSVRFVTPAGWGTKPERAPTCRIEEGGKTDRSK